MVDRSYWVINTETGDVLKSDLAKEDANWLATRLTRIGVKAVAESTRSPRSKDEAPWAGDPGVNDSKTFSPFARWR